MHRAFSSECDTSGEVIVYDGSHGDNYYIVDEGIVDVYRRVKPASLGGDQSVAIPVDHLKMTTASGKEFLRARTLTSGSWFGELTIKFPNHVSEYRYVARTPCKLHAMERSHFQQVSNNICPFSDDHPRLHVETHPLNISL